MSSYPEYKLEERDKGRTYIQCNNCRGNDVTEDSNPSKVFFERGWKVIRHMNICKDCNDNFVTYKR